MKPRLSDVAIEQSRRIDALRAENARLRRELDLATLALVRIRACPCITPTSEEN